MNGYTFYLFFLQRLFQILFPKKDYKVILLITL
jgi:hypothetical protein